MSCLLAFSSIHFALFYHLPASFPWKHLGSGLDRFVSPDSRVCLWGSGSSSPENGRSFKVGVMEKQVQTGIMHEQKCGERERFVRKTLSTLAQPIIPAFRLSRLSCFLPYRRLQLF